MRSEKRSSWRGSSHVAGAIAAWVEREILHLDPAGFALVMATGIVSNGFFLQGYRRVSDVLLLIGLVACAWLWLLTALRIGWFRGALWRDLVGPQRVFAFFTIVAATDVLGVALVQRGFTTIALAMWLAAFAIWLALIYLGFGIFAFRNAAGGASVLSGAWLNGIVGTQSLVILGAQIALPAANAGSAAVLAIHVFWALGISLYGILVVLLSYRLFFFGVEPSDVGPWLWVIMGAAAISANAGSNLITVVDSGHDMRFLNAMLPFVDGVTFVMWAWATWWMPLLILLGIWKHGLRRAPLSYSPMLWSMVFPLGMYSVASLRLSRGADVPILLSWSGIIVWIALGAWSATFAGLAVSTWRSAQTFIDERQRSDNTPVVAAARQ